MHIIF